MKRIRTIGTLLAALALANLLPGAEPTNDESKFNEQQRKALKHLKGTLQVFPVVPAARDEKVQAARDDFRQLLSITVKPSASAADAMATSLALGLNGGQITLDQSMALSKELVKVLDLPVITSRDTYGFVRAIEPLVQGSGLNQPEKMRLYREALSIVQTSPNYSYNQR